MSVGRSPLAIGMSAGCPVAWGTDQSTGHGGMGHGHGAWGLGMSMGHGERSIGGKRSEAAVLNPIRAISDSGRNQHQRIQSVGSACGVLQPQKQP